MKNLAFLFLFALLIIMQANGHRLIYRDPVLDQTTTMSNKRTETETVMANIIGAPQNCNRGERLDRMNKCRKVSNVCITCSHFDEIPKS